MEYPLERAEEMQRKLDEGGTLGNGLTILDNLRNVITQIGNALSLVCVSKAAHKRYCYDIQQFVTERTKETYGQLAQDCQQTPETCVAATLVDKYLEKECGNLDIEDFKMYLNMFDEATLKSEECKHLELFYIVVPALSINFVNSIMNAKNTLKTRNMSKVYFCDDGFAVGLAYFLKIFQQTDKFGGLNWFESLINRYAKDQKANTNLHVTEQQMMIKKAFDYKKEFEGLFYSFITAQQFFKD